MEHPESYITWHTLEARTSAWHTELARAGIGRNPDPARPGKSALLVIDMQRFFLRKDSHAFLPAGRCVLPNVLRLIHAWQDAGAPVILTRHAVAVGEDPGAMARWWNDTVREDTEDSQLDSDVAKAAAGAPVLRKTRYSAFHGTGLEESLRELGVERVVIVGVMTHLCVESTAREAFVRDFEVLLVTDASASTSEELHLGSLRALGHGFAFLARTKQLIDQIQPGGANA